MDMIATSATRGAAQVADEITDRIRRQTEANIAWYRVHPEQIDQRLEELAREWDVERWLQLNSAALSLAGLSLAMAHSKWWLLLPVAVQGFFLQHAVQGWCPPLPVFRRLNVRTEWEIQRERAALLAMRVDEGPAERHGRVAEAAETIAPGEEELA